MAIQLGQLVTVESGPLGLVGAGTREGEQLVHRFIMPFPLSATFGTLVHMAEKDTKDDKSHNDPRGTGGTFSD